MVRFRKRLKSSFAHVPQPLRLVLVGIVGTVVVLVGIVLLPLPGPGSLVILLGLAILGLEFPFARRWVVRIRYGASRAWTKLKSRRSNTRAN